MAKPTNEKPDKKQIDKATSNIKKLNEELKDSSKELKDVAAIAKELDQMRG
jgi:hypothetical protein